MGSIFYNDYAGLFNSQESVLVLATGDSWFHYLFDNVLNPLYETLERPTIFAIGDSGKRADELAEGYWLSSYRRMLNDHPSIQLVCISAGGNDFAGIGDLDAKILKDDCTGQLTPADCYRPGQPDGVFAAVYAAYRTLVAEAQAIRPGIPILIQAYDYAIPDGRTLGGMRSWLKLPMDNAKVDPGGAPYGGVRREIVRDLIDRFILVLDAIQDEFPPAQLIWSPGTLTDNQWANELHPTPQGFKRIVRECWSGPARAALGLP